jgi:hypothetical protein
MRWRTGAVVALVGWAGCREPGRPVGDGGIDAGVADAGAAASPLALTLVVSPPDAGVERHALLALETPLVTPAQTLEVAVNRRLHNARVRILDETDRALASDDVPEESGEGLRYHIQLLAPLQPGHRYALLVDAQSGATLDDGAGHEIPEQRLEFRTSGERERPKPPPTRKRHRHRG